MTIQPRAVWTTDEIQQLRELFPVHGARTVIPGKSKSQIIGKAGVLRLHVKPEHKLKRRARKFGVPRSADFTTPETKTPRER